MKAGGEGEEAESSLEGKEEGRSPWGSAGSSPHPEAWRHYHPVESLPGPDTGDRCVQGNSPCLSKLGVISQEAGPTLGGSAATPEGSAPRTRPLRGGTCAPVLVFASWSTSPRAWGKN